jgi:hypothetical protein
MLRAFCTLFAVLLFALVGFAQDLPVATPVDPATLTAPAAPALPPTALLITVLVPLVIAGLKKLFPQLPAGSLPVIAPILGGLLEYGLGQLGLNAGGTVAGAVAGGAGVGLREIVKQNSGKAPPGSVAMLCGLGSLLFLGAGCTSFHVEQGDVSPEREITFKLSGRAWGSGQQVIAQLKALQTDKSQSFGVDSVSNKGPTNAVAVIEATTKLLNAAKP